jgi:copper chaperone CopZ
MAQRKTVLNVLGMSCGSCVRHVTAALAAVPGVSKVDVQLRSGTAVIEHDAEATTAHLMIDALRGAGYESSVRDINAGLGGQ